MSTHNIRFYGEIEIKIIPKYPPYLFRWTVLLHNEIKVFPEHSIGTQGPKASSSRLIDYADVQTDQRSSLGTRPKSF